MGKRIRLLEYRVFNQTRVAMHIDNWLHAWKALSEPPEGRRRKGWLPGYLRMSTFQSLVSHLDFMKLAKQGDTLEGLIDESFDTGRITKLQRDDLKSRIVPLYPVLDKIRMQRNNIVSHRSKQFTFKELNDLHPISRDELEKCAKVYYEVARDLYQLVPLRDVRPFDLMAAKDAADALNLDLSESM